MPRGHRSMSKSVSTRTIGGQSCCAVVVNVPATNCGDDCIKGHRHTADFNVGRFLNQLQVQFFDVQKRQYPVVVFHEDLDKTQKRMLRAKTLSPILFYKVNLNPMALPNYLRPHFAEVVNVTKVAHRNGDLFRTEMSGAAFRGFQQRMLSRFLAGDMVNSPVLKGYNYVMRFDAINARIASAFPYDPFLKAHSTNLIYGYRSTTEKTQSSKVDSELKNWFIGHQFSGKLLKRFTYNENGNFLYNGRSFSTDFEMLHLPSFQSTMHTYMFDSLDRKNAFLLGDSSDTSLEESQFRAISVSFLHKSSPQTVAELPDLPLNFPVDQDEPYI